MLNLFTKELSSVSTEQNVITVFLFDNTQKTHGPFTKQLYEIIFSLNRYINEKYIPISIIFFVS